MRIEKAVRRGEPFTISVDERLIAAYPGETLATAMIAAGIDGFRLDKAGRGRGPFCNMGTCCECMLTLVAHGRASRIRACLVDAKPGQVVQSGRSASDG